MTVGYDILLYHGVHEDGLELGLRNSSGKHVALSRFEAEMRHLATHRPLVSIVDIAAAYRGERSLPDGAVAVTFDDGFLNNYTSAWPVLEAYKVPTTFYLATGFIGTDRMVWSDRLEASILGTAAPEIEIEFDGVKTSWPLATAEEKIRAFLDIKAMCKRLSDENKNYIVNMVEAALGVEDSGDHPLYAFLNWDQVREMNRSPLITFGAHTVDHVSLARVSNDVMRHQIVGSMNTLSREIGEPVFLFSYPEGQATDYNEDVIAYLRSLGFDHALSAIEGSNTLDHTDPFHIRRIMVGFEGRPYPFGRAN